MRQFDGPPTSFWPAFLEALGRLAGADSASVFIRAGGVEWKPVAHVPKKAGVGVELRESGLAVADLGDRALLEGMFSETLKLHGGRSAELLVVNVTPPESATVVVALLVLPRCSEAEMERILERVRLGRDTPAIYAQRRRLVRAEEDIESFASTLDLLRVMDSRKRYLETVMTLCNEGAARFRCERVSVGWLEKGDVRLQGISHTEKFEKKMAAIRELEEVMEEALDQDSDIIVPVPDGSDGISRTHELFAKAQGGGSVASFPLRSGENAVGVLTMERAEGAFDEAELRSLRLLGDQVVTRLGDLKKHDRWFGARMWAATREGAAKLVGVEKTGWKMVGLAAAIALAVLIFGGATYRVEAPFILKSDTLAQVPAGFNGYIAEVHYRLGDEVKEGDVLIRLDTRQLLLEEAGALAEQRKHRSEMQRAEAEGELAQMRIAGALAEQAAAKLELTRFRLAQGEITAPFDGVVVEGDLRERIGSPVEQGEVLLKVARLDEMYAEGKIDERNLNLVGAGGGGQIAFASEPETKFSVAIERIEPLAVAEEAGSVFIVRCTFPGGPEEWWRPGMSGLCKIDTTRRSYLWMLTHKTVDFLRMKFWW